MRWSVFTSTGPGDVAASAAGRCGHSRAAASDLPRGNGESKLRHPRSPPARWFSAMPGIPWSAHVSNARGLESQSVCADSTSAGTPSMCASTPNAFSRSSRTSVARERRDVDAGPSPPQLLCRHHRRRPTTRCRIDSRVIRFRFGTEFPPSSTEVCVRNSLGSPQSISRFCAVRACSQSRDHFRSLRTLGMGTLLPSERLALFVS